MLKKFIRSGGSWSKAYLRLQEAVILSLCTFPMVSWENSTIHIMTYLIETALNAADNKSKQTSQFKLTNFPTK